MGDDRRQSAVSQFFYDSNAGTVMGRTGRSWAKILLFYAIYYSFLAIIFFVSLETMKAISKPKSLGSRGFAPTQTRLDQPGLTVYPHQENRDDNDGLAYPICFGKPFEDTRYYQDLQTFLKAKSYENIDGFESPDVKKYVDEWKTLVKGSYDNRKVTVFLALNKVLNFELKGVSSLVNTTGKIPFQHKSVTEKNKFDKNSAYFNCLSLNDKGEIIADGSKANATIDLANVDATFPYPGRISQNDYNKQNTQTTDVNESQNQFKNIAKPFVAFDVDFKEAKEGSKNKFVCFPIAGNINNSEQSDLTREKYSKNGLGRLEFGFELLGAEDERCDKI